MKRATTFTIEETVSEDFSMKVEKESAKRNIGNEKKYNNSSKVQQLMDLYIKKGEAVFE